jgi:hypothetical protein
MKLKLRLVLNLEFDPHGGSVVYLKDRIHDMIHQAADYGTFTGESNAELKNYSYSLTKSPAKKTVQGKRKHSVR